MLERESLREAVVSDEPEIEWRWRNLRRFAIGIEFWPLDWTLDFDHWADHRGGESNLMIGPISLVFKFNSGPLKQDHGDA